MPRLRNYSARIFLLTNFLFLLARYSWAQDDRAVLTLTINEVQKGTVIVRLRGGDILMQVSDLRESGVQNFSGQREVIDGEDYVSLRSLAPGIRFQLDED